MLVSMKDILSAANRGKYAVLAINCFNLESACATVKAAEKRRSPIIIDLLQEHMEKHIAKEILLPSVVKMAKMATVDVAINLDHGKSVDYVKECIVDGFTGVMIDQSEGNFKDNVRITKEIMDCALPKNIGVEAEVGNMGAVKNDQFTKQEMYTNPKEAIKFIRRTNVTALAISFGSSHGVMPKDFIPKFNFDIVKEIKKATGIPLVMHGGSGCGKDNIAKAVTVGINKVNVGSDILKAQSEAVYLQQQEDRYMDYVDLLQITMTEAEKAVDEYIDVVGSTNKTSVTL